MIWCDLGLSEALCLDLFDLGNFSPVSRKPPSRFWLGFLVCFFFCLFVLFFCAFVAFLVFFFFAFLFPESEVKSDISLAQDESPLRCVSFHCFSPSLQGKETIHRSQDMRICSQLFDV